MKGRVKTLIAMSCLLFLTIGAVLSSACSSNGAPPPASATPERLPSPGPATPDSTPHARLVIPRINVDAPIETLGIDADGKLQVPTTPYSVGWYDFSARPGAGGNAVFVGGADAPDIGPAVFWNLHDVKPGNAVEIHLQNGTIYHYAVTVQHCIRLAPPPPLADILGPTPGEVVTLITSCGTYNSSQLDYDSRLIVRADRILPTSP